MVWKLRASPAPYYSLPLTPSTSELFPYQLFTLCFLAFWNVLSSCLQLANRGSHSHPSRPQPKCHLLSERLLWSPDWRRAFLCSSLSQLVHLCGGICHNGSVLTRWLPSILSTQNISSMRTGPCLSCSPVHPQHLHQCLKYWGSSPDIYSMHELISTQIYHSFFDSFSFFWAAWKGTYLYLIFKFKVIHQDSYWLRTLSVPGTVCRYSGDPKKQTGKIGGNSPRAQTPLWDQQAHHKTRTEE